MSDYFLQQRAELLYRFDVNKHLIGINETDSTQSIPYFYLMRTASHRLCYIHHEIPNDIAHNLQKLAETEPRTFDLQKPAHYQTYSNKCHMSFYN